MMLLKCLQDEQLKIKNSVVTYLIVFFVLLPLSYIKNSLYDDLKLFTSKILKVILLLLIIFLTITKNTQIAVSVAIFFIYVSIFDSQLSESFKSKKKNKINNRDLLKI